MKNIYTAGPELKAVGRGSLSGRSPGASNAGNGLPCIGLPISPGTPLMLANRLRPDSKLTNVPESP